MLYSEIKKDLFNVGNDYSLVHCISEDAELGAGIALVFNRKYPELRPFILNKGKCVGVSVNYYNEAEKRYIFNLITKEKYWHKPTYRTFLLSLMDLKKSVVRKNIKKIAMPKIGSGLDKLDWNINKQLIQEVFKDTNVEIIVCHL